jgi:hypothetical protein
MKRTISPDAIGQPKANWTDADYEAACDELLQELRFIVEDMNEREKRIERSQLRIRANFQDIEKRLAKLRAR